MLSVGIFAFDNCMYSSVMSPIDIFSVANMEWEELSGDSRLFNEVRIISPDNRPVRSFNSLDIIPDQGMDDRDQYDIIITPVIFGDFDHVLERKDIIDWLKKQHEKGACICSVCAGAFLTAETGLLDNRSATTHWKLAKEFRRKYPRVNLKPEKILIDEGEFICAGGITSYLDLSLYITGRFGSPELASTLSKLLLIDSARQAQLPYQTYSFQKAHGDEEILRAQELLENHFSEKITVPELADIAGLSERTFTRRFKKATGDTPVVYCQMIRIEAARKMLETTNESVEYITNSTGYEDISSFRRLFKQQTGLSPSNYRKKFSVLKYHRTADSSR